MISIKSIFKRTLGSKTSLVAIKTLAYSPSSSKISIRPIFNVHSKCVSFKEKLSLQNFKKHGPSSCASKGSHFYDEIHESNFIRFSKHSSSSHSSAFFEASHFSSFDTFTELISEESSLPSTSYFQYSNFIRFVS